VEGRKRVKKRIFAAIMLFLHPRFRTLASLCIAMAMTALLAACGSDKPDGLLTEDEMVPVLKDLHIAYAGVDLTVSDLKERSARYAEVNQMVLSKYNLDQQQFDNSYDYYQHNPYLMDTIYIKVIDELNMELAQMSGQKPTTDAPVKPPPGLVRVEGAPADKPN
jgi:hypothetical protein